MEGIQGFFDAITTYFEGLNESLAPLNKELDRIEGWVWGPALVVLLLGTHLFLTFRLGFIQKYLGKMIRLSVIHKKEGEGEIHHFGALSTAMAATVGTGNIFGVAGALLIGGPGAVFWMWLTGVFGIATKYGEAVLSLKYRQVDPKGQVRGGPMFVCEHGLNAKWLGIIFAVFTAIAGFGIGNIVQADAIAGTVENAFAIEPWVTGVVLTVLTGIVILGGVKWIARVCQFLVPVMVVVYVIGCIIIIALHIDQLGPAFAAIFNGAFRGYSPEGEAVAGGFIGALIATTVKAGVARGLFSNEAGLGSAPIVAAAAQSPNPVRQALVSASATFWDTVVICLLSALAFLCSGALDVAEKKDDVAYQAFATMPLGEIILPVALATFVFSTILGWSYYGETAVEYLFGVKSIVVYRVVWVAMVMFGAVAGVDIAWNFSDIANPLMALPNVICLLLLSGVIASETRKYINEPEKPTTLK